MIGDHYLLKEALIDLYSSHKSCFESLCFVVNCWCS